MGVWADGTDIFVSDMSDGKVYAYWRTFKQPNPGRDFQLAPLQTASDQGRGPRGVWSDGSTMWVADRGTGKIYAYALPPLRTPLNFRSRVSVERVTETTAIVAMDLRNLPLDGERSQAVKMNIGLGGYTIYPHPDAGTARFLLRGMEPETQYTVRGRFSDSPGFPLGGVTFRTDYARLDGIEASNLTHNEATVKVSLAGADVNKRAYPNYWVSRERTDPDHTFYLRHKASDETEWRESVELTFSDFTAAASLTGLDPGTVYDVEVAETATFMPPQGSAGSYDGTMTVGSDFFAGLGYDQVGQCGICDPYGSLTPTTFELGGVEHSIVELRVGAGFAPADQQGKLFLTFDRTLPDDAAFTLTLGTTEFESSDATVSGPTYSWANGPSLTNGGEVTVKLDFTGVAAFREGTTLAGAFSTPPLPTTLAFEAEITVGTGTSFDGYDADTGSPIGSVSPGNTFEVGGIQYTVEHVGFNTGDNKFDLSVSPAPLFGDSFTLTLAATQPPVLVKNTGQSAGSSNGSLTTTFTKRAQAFTTGTNADGYTLGSIGIVFYAIGNPSNAGSQLTVTLNDEDSDGNPDSVLCTLTNPTSFSDMGGLHTFNAPTTCPKLAASTTYFAVIERANATADNIRLNYTVNSGEDAGGAVGWSIANNRRTFSSSSSAWTTCCDPQTSVIRIEVSAPAAVVGPLTAPSISIDSDGVGQYTWSGTNPNWASGATVDVKLEVPLIDICARSPAVAGAIKAATPSFDFCHMTAPIDLANLTELDLPGGRGTGLKAGDFEGLSGLTRLDLSHYILSLQQLPVGVFDGLDSLTHLDISHTGLLKLDRGVFDGLDNLIELDLGDTRLQAGTVPVGVFDDVPNLEVLRLSNESSIGGYRRSFSNLNDDFFRGLVDLRELDVGDSTPLRDSPRSLLPLTSLMTLNGRSYTLPADPPGNLQYASGRIDHELGYHRTCYTVTLKWDAPTGVSGITGYRVLRNLGTESLSRYAKRIATTGASARTFVDGRDADVCFGGVGSGPNVSYFVSAITADGDSFPARVRVDQTAASVPDHPGSEHAYAARLPVRPFRREESQRLQGAPAVERPSSQHHRLRDLLPGVERGRLADHRGQRRKRAGVRRRIDSDSALLGAKDRGEHVPVLTRSGTRECPSDSPMAGSSASGR